MLKERFMKKSRLQSDELRPEYQPSDFRKLERGKYYDRIKKNSNVVILDQEVATVFPNSAAVNRALHLLMEVGSASQVKSGSHRRSRVRRSNGRS